MRKRIATMSWRPIFRSAAKITASLLFLAGASTAFAQTGPAMYQEGVTPMPMQPTGSGQVSV
ncbi:MAG TPA: hypothetical protein VM555_05745, partial [Tahibacter sp.]|nr:hypothetical protein [Tahibacter sp.]